MPAASSRSGVALVVVLGVLILVTVLLSTGLRSAWLARAQLVLYKADVQQEVLRKDSEHLAIAYLVQNGSQMTTPSDQWWQPAIIFDDTVVTERGETLRLAVAAWDVRAAVPLTEDARRVRGVLPPELQQVPDSAPLPLPRTVVATSDLPSGWRRYPARLAGDAVAHDGEGDMVASLWLGVFGDIAINVQTASPELLAAVLDGRQRGGVLDQILTARDEGTVPTLPPDVLRAQDGWPALTTKTDRWRVGITTTSGGRSQSWWNVVLGGGPKLSIVQRQVGNE